MFEDGVNFKVLEKAINKEDIINDQEELVENDMEE
jgi:hypothetical protein